MWADPQVKFNQQGTSIKVGREWFKPANVPAEMEWKRHIQVLESHMGFHQNHRTLGVEDNLDAPNCKDELRRTFYHSEA